MLDSDVAELYKTETRRVNEKVKRNIKRFPEDFCFQLTKEELENLKSQIATSSSTKVKRERAEILTEKEKSPSNLESQSATSSLMEDSYGGK